MNECWPYYFSYNNYPNNKIGLQKDPHHSKEVSYLHGVHKAHFALHIQGLFTSHVTFTDPWTAVTSP